MIIILKNNADQKKVAVLESLLRDKGIDIHESQGTSTKILGLVGDTLALDIDQISANEVVAEVRRIQEPYKKANRKMHPIDTVVDCGGIKIGTPINPP